MDTQQDAKARTKAKATVAESVSTRIRDAAKKRGVDALQMQSRFAVERFLQRLASSAYAELAALKGGVLIVALTGDQARPTQDLNMYMNEGLDERALRDFIKTVCAVQPAEEDGLTFEATDLSIDLVRDRHAVEPGFLVKFDAFLETRPRRTPIRMKVDLAWGAVQSVSSVEIPPALKGFPPVQVRSYPWEHAVADKIHSIVRHGAINTRFKDFYDLIVFSRREPFDGAALLDAVHATFAEWHAFPEGEPVGLSEAWARDNERDWTRFRAGKALKLDLPSMTSVVAEVRAFVQPILAAASANQPFPQSWVPGNGWSHTHSLAPTEAVRKVASPSP